MSEKTKVMSLRLDQQTYRRLNAYGTSRGISDSAAARELIAGGLAEEYFDGERRRYRLKE